MRLLVEVYESVMSELFVHGDRKNAKYLIAYKENVWLLSDESIDDSVLQHISRATGKELDDNDFHDLSSALEEEQEIIFGQIDAKKRSLYLHGVSSMTLDAQTSVTLKKIAKELKLNRIERMAGSSEYDVTVKKGKIKGQLPDVVYHGTSSEYLRDILRLGLKPDERETNYPRVISQDPEFLEKIKGKVYFTSKFDEAQHHATYTAERVGGDPVIIQMRVPDKNLIQVDYDVEKQFSQGSSKKGFSMSRETGIFGYAGRVPSSHIDYVYAAVGKGTEGPEAYAYLTDKDYKKMNKKRAISYLDRLDDYGY